MFCRPLLVLLLCLSPFLFAACESDSSKASENPGLSVPINPPRPPETDLLQLEVQLDGRYVKGLRIRPGDWSAIGPGEEIALTFQATGLQGIGQFDLILEPQPVTRFEISASRFVPRPPFVTLQSGVEQLEDGRVRFIGVNFERSTSGDAELGTLHLKTPASFSPRSQLRLRVIFFSIGPTSTARDSYQAGDLHLGIVVNRP